MANDHDQEEEENLYESRDRVFISLICFILLNILRKTNK